MTALRSSLYECRVTHHRFLPKVHRFAYRLFLFSIDLDELGDLARGVPLLSVNGRNLYSFREDDYFPTTGPVHNARAPQGVPAEGGLKARVLAFLGAHGVDVPGARIVLLTMPRVAGFLFNPVSFYFCFDPDGRAVAAIAEVTNTFREVKPYFLGPDALSGTEGGGGFRARRPKHFYVSPFSDVDVCFDFRLPVPDAKLAIRIDDYDASERTLACVLAGRRVPLEGARLAWFALKYPLLTLKVIALIHIQALFLRLRRVPWFAKAARAADQRDLYRPHRSIERVPIPRQT